MKILKFNGDKLVMGKNSIDYLNDIDMKSVCIISGGQSMRANGTLTRIEKILDLKAVDYFHINNIKINPDTLTVLDGVKKLEAFEPDTIIAVGGGSCIDAAKVMSLFYEYDYLNFEEALKSELPQKRYKTTLIAIPSTAGTGTEVTRAAVITYEKNNLKVGLKSLAFIPDIAILDPEVTLSLPSNIVAETGMDALTHAIECYINNNLDDFTEVLAKGAITGLFKYLPTSYKENTLEAREKVLNYQSMAGLAFHNVGLGLDHGIAHAFGGKYDLGHGLLNGVALPYVLQYNSRDDKVKAKLDGLSTDLGFDIIEEIKSLKVQLNIPRCFYYLGISEETFKYDFEWLVENSLKGSTNSNPVKVDVSDMKMILKSIYYGYDIKG